MYKELELKAFLLSLQNMNSTFLTLCRVRGMQKSFIAKFTQPFRQFLKYEDYCVEVSICLFLLNNLCYIIECFWFVALVSSQYLLPL